MFIRKKYPENFAFLVLKILQLFDREVCEFLIVGDAIRCVVQIMTKTCTFLHNLIESSTFKLEGVPNLKDPHLPKIGSNFPIPHSPVVINILFFSNSYILYTV